MMAAGGGDDVGGDTGEFAVAIAVGGVKNERHERGARRDDFYVELAGKVIAEGSGAHFGDGEAAGGDDYCGRAKFFVVRAHDEFGGALDLQDFCIQENSGSYSEMF